jgi:hypothetical protein
MTTLFKVPQEMKWSEVSYCTKNHTEAAELYLSTPKNWYETTYNIPWHSITNWIPITTAYI